MRTVAAPLPMITVPLVLRRFFGSIKDASDVNDLLESLLEIASLAAVSRSKSADNGVTCRITPDMSATGWERCRKA